MLIASGLLGLATLAPSYHACIDAQREAKESKPEAQWRIPVFIRCEGAFLDANGVLLTAIATLAIAWFTRTLKRSTDRLWESADEGLKATERAFVYIDGFDTEVTTGAEAIAGFGELPLHYRGRSGLYLTRFAARPRWKNSGTTPTRGMKIQVDWGGFPPLPMPPTYEYRDQPIPFFLGPKAIEGSWYIEMPPARSLIEYEAFREGQKSRILIWGRADYGDVFGKLHFVEWCYELRFDMHDGRTLRASFIQIGEHNRTDEDHQ